MLRTLGYRRMPCVREIDVHHGSVEPERENSRRQDHIHILHERVDALVADKQDSYSKVDISADAPRVARFRNHDLSFAGMPRMSGLFITSSTRARTSLVGGYGRRLRSTALRSAISCRSRSKRDRVWSSDPINVAWFHTVGLAASGRFAGFTKQILQLTDGQVASAIATARTTIE